MTKPDDEQKRNLLALAEKKGVTLPEGFTLETARRMLFEELSEISTRPRTRFGGYAYTEEEQRAFDAGLNAGYNGAPFEPPYDDPYLNDAWEHGHNTGLLSTHSKEQEH